MQLCELIKQLKFQLSQQCFVVSLQSWKSGFDFLNLAKFVWLPANLITGRLPGSDWQFLITRLNSKLKLSSLTDSYKET